MNLYTNNATTALAAGLSNVATSLTVTTGGGSLFPTITAGNVFNVTIISGGTGTLEIVQVTARAGDVFTIVRAQGGTTAGTFITGDRVELRITAANATNWENKVTSTSPTGSAVIPAGTTAQRDASPSFGYQHANLTLNIQEWWNGTAWVAMGGGASGSGTDAVGYENDQYITQPFVVGQSAMVSGAAISIATPGVVTQTNSFVAGQPVRFTTTGALPTGLTTNGQYFVSSAGLTTASFQVAATQAAAIAGTGSIATSGTQSGVHSVGKIKNMEMVGFTLATSGSFTIPTGSRVVIL